MLKLTYKVGKKNVGTGTDASYMTDSYTRRTSSEDRLTADSLGCQGPTDLVCPPLGPSRSHVDK